MTSHDDLLKRREFLKLLGPGIYFLFSIDALLLGQQPRSTAGSYPEDFNAYFRIAEDGHVTCYSGKVELGQGIIASLAQMLAEELEVPFNSVSMVMGDTKLCPWDGGTNGSRSIKYFGPALRQAAEPCLVQWLELVPSPDWMCRSELMLPPLRALLANTSCEIRFERSGRTRTARSTRSAA